MALQRPQHAPQQLRLPEPTTDSISYAVFDLETTGLDSRTCTIIEIGWCVVRDGVASAPCSRLITCTVVPAEIQRLTGITPAMLAADGVPIEQGLRDFFRETEGLPLVGHNILRFDCQFVEAACLRAGLPSPGRGRYRDTAALYKAQKLGLLPQAGQDHRSFALGVLDRRIPGLRYSLAAACDDLKISVSGIQAHRAAGDVAMTHALYLRLLAGG